MVVLYIYLGSIAYALVVNGVYSAAAEKYIKRQGYEIVKVKKSFSEKLAGYVSILIYASIPVINVIVPTIMALTGSEKLAEKIIPKLLEEGKIKKIILSSEDVNTENMKSCNIESEDLHKFHGEEKVVLNENGFKVTVTEIYSDTNYDKGHSRSRSKFNN